MMGLSYDELYDLTPRSFSNKLLGFNNYNNKPKKDIASKEHIQEVIKRYNKNKIKKLN